MPAAERQRRTRFHFLVPTSTGSLTLHRFCDEAAQMFRISWFRPEPAGTGNPQRDSDRAGRRGTVTAGGEIAAILRCAN
ncbi:hypothetical protein CCH79_00017099 [Gambusia affinis]|uniref:Uncharacterized protein n=1 Tax=Gambusia affinis TaxID=33528 RepID=A0A315W1C5_GAMAF|nr:hypothetical protein CCH79_00017099 [Gambusia affinis]